TCCAKRSCRRSTRCVRTACRSRWPPTATPAPRRCCRCARRCSSPAPTSASPRRKPCAVPPSTQRARSGSLIAACCEPACAPTSRAGTCASRRSFATGWAGSWRWRCSRVGAGWIRGRGASAAPTGMKKPRRGRGFGVAARAPLLLGRLLGDGLARRLGHRLGRGLLRDRGGRGAGAAGGAGDAGARLAVAGDVALALGGLAVALAHVLLLENARMLAAILMHAAGVVDVDFGQAHVGQV